MYVTGALVMIFKVVLALNDDDCYKNSTSTSGVIKSPNYPDWYENNLDCIYRIRSPSDKPVTLVFVEFYVYSNADCDYDYVELKDGDEIYLGKYCGYTNPDPVIALSGTLVVTFHTDYHYRDKGFEAFYNDSQDCVHIIERTEGSFVSPNFPEHYPVNILCLFLIRGLNGLPMNLTFTRFELEYYCYYDSLTIKDGMQKSASRLGTFCGNRLPSIPIIAKGTVFLIFKSDEVNSRHGFSAVFREEAVLGCSGHLNVTSGRIQSPNYPDNYDDNKDCTYHLSSIHNYPINLTFIDFHLEDQADCTFDYVKIHTADGHEKKLCGSPDVPLQFTLGSSVTIIFHSDTRINDKGFNAVFREITVQTTTERSATTDMESLDSTFITSSSLGMKTEPSPEMPRSFASYSTVASSITGNIDSTVPLIAGIVAGIAVFTILIAVILIWFLRKKRSRQKHETKAFGNKNYNVQYISKENISSSSVNDNVTYCNVQNNIPRHKTAEVEEANGSVIHHQSTTSEYNYATTKNGFRSSIGDVNKTESDYIDQEDSYNILNVNPSKTSTTENIYDRSTEGAYDSAQTFATQSSQDVGTYDRYPANGDNDYDTAQDIMSRDDSSIYS